MMRAAFKKHTLEETFPDAWREAIETTQTYSTHYFGVLFQLHLHDSPATAQEICNRSQLFLSAKKPAAASIYKRIEKALQSAIRNGHAKLALHSVESDQNADRYAITSMGIQTVRLGLQSRQSMFNAGSFPIKRVFEIIDSESIPGDVESQDGAATRLRSSPIGKTPISVTAQHPLIAWSSSPIQSEFVSHDDAPHQPSPAQINNESSSTTLPDVQTPISTAPTMQQDHAPATSDSTPATNELALTPQTLPSEATDQPVQIQPDEKTVAHDQAMDAALQAVMQLFNFDGEFHHGGQKVSNLLPKSLNRMFDVPVANLVPKEGFNPRIDRPALTAHIRNIADSIKANGYYQDKPLTGIPVLRDGIPYVEVTDGNCRLKALRIAISEGTPIASAPVVLKSQSQNIEDLTVALARSNDGERFIPLEMSIIVSRLIGYGWTVPRISEKLGITQTYVSQLSTIAGAPREIRKMLEAEQVAVATAVKVMAQHGADAAAVLTQALEAANLAGKKRTSPKFIGAETRFSKKAVQKAAPDMLSVIGKLSKDKQLFTQLPEDIQAAITSIMDKIREANQKQREALEAAKQQAIQNPEKAHPDLLQEIEDDKNLRQLRQNTDKLATEMESLIRPKKATKTGKPAKAKPQKT